MKLVSLYQLNENENISLEEAVKIFHDNCKPFQKEIGFNNSFDFEPFYRGMKNKPNILIGSVRTDRKPMNTPLPIHEFMDNWFYKKFGVKFRSNAMFTIKDKPNAKFFGDVYIVFPIGEFKYCYSNDVFDLYDLIISKIQQYTDINATDINTFLSDKQHLKTVIDIVEKILIDSNYVDSNLKALSVNSEIMINCKSYLAIKESEYEKFIDLYQETYK